MEFTPSLEEIQPMEVTPPVSEPGSLFFGDLCGKFRHAGRDFAGIKVSKPPVQNNKSQTAPTGLRIGGRCCVSRKMPPGSHFPVGL